MLMGRFAVYGLTHLRRLRARRRERSAVRVVLRVRRGERPDRRAAGVLPHRASAAASASTARSSSRPTSRTFGQFPFIKALDPDAQPSPDPMDELRRSADVLPACDAASSGSPPGISFTSFALVDGIAVVAVEIGDGLEISLLGLARMALPRPQFALVSIELGLVARFSSKRRRALGARRSSRTTRGCSTPTCGSRAASRS